MLLRRQEKGVTRVPWPILVTMLSSGERQAVANGLRVGAGSGGFYQCSEGGSYFALGQNCCNLNCRSVCRAGKPELDLCPHTYADRLACCDVHKHRTEMVG